MINKTYRLKGFVFTLLILLGMPFMSSAQQHEGDFPFFRSFLDGKTDGISYMNNNGSATNKADLTSEGMRLTAGTAEVGAFYLDKHTFTTGEGMLIEFEYMMYGESSALTDGITMFLVDGTTALNGTLTFGAHGAGFGYTHRWASYAGHRIPGILGGYLAVALDNGPFKTIRFEGEEQRNGVPYKAVGANPAREITSTQATVYDTRSNVTIRGAAGRTTLSMGYPSFNGNMGPGYWGYPMLITRHTGWGTTTGTSDPNNYRNKAGFQLDVSSGEFVSHVTPEITSGFNISGQGKFTSPNEAAYRKAFIFLDPDKVNGGFKISVAIQHGEEKTLVIDQYSYPATVTYMENALIETKSDLGWLSTFKDSKKNTYTVNAPAKLLIGFTGSTGTQTAYTNVIKNLRITLLRAANTADDDIYSHRRGAVTSRPFDNDLACKDEDGTVTVSKENVDPASFRFWLNEDTCLNAAREWMVEGQGKWVYDESMSEVMFFPIKGFKGKATIMYDIKSKHAPYNQEQYRSSLAMISVTINDNQPVR